MTEKPRIVIVTPRSPFQGRGADEQDRLSGIEWFIRKGFDVRVITKVFDSDVPFVVQAEKKLGIKIFAIPYKKKSFLVLLKRLVNPLCWDGAAYEYFDKEIQIRVEKELVDFKPSIVWFDYTYLWPLYRIVRKHKTPIITRSINFEPTHFLDEDGRNLLNYLRAIPKLLSEWFAFRRSDYFFSITPREEQIYKLIGKTALSTLPLRSLPLRIKSNISPQEHAGVKIGFMPSTYKVRHNIEALQFIITDVLDLIPDSIRQSMSVHITGNKLPEEIRLPNEIIYRGFVPSSIEFWKEMDIALSPSLFGAGMQQKIFEPLSLGKPTVTSQRGVAGYPYTCGKDLVCASGKEDVAEALVELALDEEKRKTIGENCRRVSAELFSEERIDSLIESAIEYVKK